MSNILKLIAFLGIAFAVTSLTGLAHFSYAKPAAESLLSFVFFSFETALSHGITGIIIAIIIIFVLKKSAQMLLTVTFILTALAGILWYIF